MFKLEQPLVKFNVEAPQKARNRSITRSSHTTVRHIYKDSALHRGICSSMVIAAVFKTAKKRKQSMCPSMKM